MRTLLAALFAGPVAFVTVETSPTAWAIMTAGCAAAFLATGPILLSRSLAGLGVVLLSVTGFTGISYFWAIVPDRPLTAARDAFGYSVAALILLLCIGTFSRQQSERALKALVAGAWVAIPILIARELYFAFAAPRADDVANTMTLHKITFYGALFAALLVARGDALSRLLASAFAAFTLLFGRSAGVDIAIFAAGLFALISTTARRHVLRWFIACYVCFAFVAPLAVPPLFTWLDAKGLLSFYPGTFAARLELWTAIANHISSAPIIGHGANTTRNATGVLPHAMKYYVLPDLPSAHNIVFDLWFELGIVGIAIYSLLPALLARRIGKLRDACHFLAASCLTISLIELSVDHRIWLSWVMGTLIMAAIICVLGARSDLSTPQGEAQRRPLLRRKKHPAAGDTTESGVVEPFDQPNRKNL